MSTELMTTEQRAPLEAIMAAMANPDVDADKLGKLLDVQERWEANGARKAYTAAMVSFQTRAPVISKGDTANGKPYARMDRIWREIRPLLTTCGLAVSWQSADYDTEKNTCTIDLSTTKGQHRKPYAGRTRPRSQEARSRIASGTRYATSSVSMSVMITTGTPSNSAQSSTLSRRSRLPSCVGWLSLLAPMCRPCLIGRALLRLMSSPQTSTRPRLRSCAGEPRMPQALMTC